MKYTCIKICIIRINYQVVNVAPTMRITEKVGSSSNTSDLYSGGTKFESAGILSILIEAFHGFPQSVQANSKVVP
jgi:hypothetical protein